MTTENKEYHKKYYQLNKIKIGSYYWMHSKSKRYMYHNKKKNQYDVCEICGRPAEQIHHIVTWKQFLDENGFTVSDLNEFGDDIIREYNDPSNLMAVCKECHQDIHMTVKIPVDYCNRSEK